MNKTSILFTALAAIQFACSDHTEETVEDLDPRIDKHSYSIPTEAVCTHLDLDLDVNFNNQVLTGTAHWSIETNDAADSIIFDINDLNITSITNGKEETLKYRLGDHDPVMGQALVVYIAPNTDKVSIAYTTPPSAKALQWTKPEQTLGKMHPFLYTQSQAILARAWIPCQDSPGIRFTYNAQVTTPEGLMALMSATNPTAPNAENSYAFEMNQPVPAYLMALTVGDVVFEPIGDRTGVYAEPGMIEKAAYEFANMDSMLVAAEALYGPYAWERYDLIVLPPSFPFGGMENPKLTFATPTIIAGDRSLTSLVAHELAHSWSGNLVTNATWDDFWLNEGFTVYFERRIMEALYGESYMAMLAELGYQDLEADVHQLTEMDQRADTKLKLNLEGRDPDDGMTDIAYEKGAYFLSMLEEKVGRERFDAFIKQYFEENAFKTMTTEKFIFYLDSNLIYADSTKMVQTNYKEWIYEPGIPANCPKFNSDRFSKVNSTLIAWSDGTFEVDEINTDDWSTHEWLHFIRQISDTVPVARIAEFDQAFGLSTSGNSEVLAAWFESTIPIGYETINAPLENFLTSVGRRKFLTPLYKALMKTDPSGERARAIYAKARPGYHSVAVQSIDVITDWKE